MTFSGTARTALLIASAIITAVVLLRALRAPVSAHQNNLFRRLPYLLAVVLELLAIAAVVHLLPQHGAERFILRAVGLIVGLHFIGLWKASRSSRFLWISAGMCLVSATAMAVPLSMGVNTGDALAGFGNAVILWLAVSL